MPTREGHSRQLFVNECIDAALKLGITVLPDPSGDMGMYAEDGGCGVWNPEIRGWEKQSLGIFKNE